MLDQSGDIYSSWVAPVDILPTAVRDLAQSNGICYVQLVRSFDEKEYLVRVSALELLLSQPSYVVILTCEELAQCLPCSMTSKSIGERALIRGAFLHADALSHDNRVVELGLQKSERR